MAINQGPRSKSLPRQKNILVFSYVHVFQTSQHGQQIAIPDICYTRIRTCKTSAFFCTLATGLCSRSSSDMGCPRHAIWRVRSAKRAELAQRRRTASVARPQLCRNAPYTLMFSACVATQNILAKILRSASLSKFEVLRKRETKIIYCS